MEVRRPEGRVIVLVPRRQDLYDVKIMALGGVLCAMAAGSVGSALGGGVGLFLVLLMVVVGLPCLFKVINPAGVHSKPATSRDAEMQWLEKVVLLAVLARIGVSILLHVTGWWSYLGGDEYTFHRNGEVFSYYLQGKLPIFLGGRFSGRDEVAFPLFVGGLYYTFGHFKLVPLFINCLIGAAVIYPVHALAGRMGGRVAARRAAVLVAFFPSLVLWSSLLVRDVWVLLFLACVLYLADRLRRDFSLPVLGGLLLSLGGLALTRTYIFLLVAAALVGGMILARRSIPQALFIGMVMMLALVVGVRHLGLGSDLVEQATLEQLATIRANNALGPSIAGSLGHADISTPTKALAYLPVGLLYFYATPFPWQIGSPRQAFALVDLLVWYALFPAILAGFGYLLRHRIRQALPLLFVVVGISVLYALVEGNMGIIFRHRAQVIVPLCAVAGAGYALRKRAARREARSVEGPVPGDAPVRGALRPSPGLRLPSRAP